MRKNRDNNKKKGFKQMLQNFLSSYRGQVIMNFAYCWGAAVVIAGALFKLTYLPGGNIMLWIGMGTEVIVFILSGFDLPNKQTGNSGSGVVVVGGAGDSAAAGQPFDIDPALQANSMQQRSVQGASSAGGTVFVGGGGGYSPSAVPAAVNTEMEETTQAYVASLKEMTEMISRFTSQTENLSFDAEQMNSLNRNLKEINAIYEMQLRGAGTQINTLDKVHEQTRKMARQIEELNELYARMLQAMQAR